MAEENVDLGRALDWDDEVEDTGEFILLDEGYYPFTISKIERERFAGSAKMAPCPRAKVTLEVTAGNRTTRITDRIMLSTKAQWRIARFFEALGFVKDTETNKMPMHWNDVDGRGGWVKIGIRHYKGKNGEDRESNEVTEWCNPTDHDKAYQAYSAVFGQTQAVSNAQPQSAPVAQAAITVPQQPTQYINTTTGGTWGM